MSSQRPTVSVVDARSGLVVFRKSLRDDARASSGTEPTRTGAAVAATTSSGLAFRYFPRHVPGGTAVRVNFTERGWLSRNATRLLGNNSHTYSDVNDNNRPSGSEEMPPSTPHSLGLPAQAVPPGSTCPSATTRTLLVEPEQAVLLAHQPCPERDPGLLLRQQVARPPGGRRRSASPRTPATSRSSTSRARAQGGDPVDTQTDDGANTDAGLPDGGHIDNANMDTPPDGQAPTMQMFLQHQPGTSYPDGDPFSPTNVGDEADTVYHEYTHGLSNRLVVDVTGHLDPRQRPGRGHGRGVERLVRHGLPGGQAPAGQQVRRGRPADLPVRRRGRVPRPHPADRLQGRLDPALCTGGETGHGGGYTYADYGNIIGCPEVHADGEIWAQTLWDLRGKLGSREDRERWSPGRWSWRRPTRRSSTCATRSWWPTPRTYQRPATTARSGRCSRSRGMGFFAGRLGGDDVAPGGGLPHPAGQRRRRARITGTVTDADTGQPVAGIPVTLAFQGSGAANPTDVTGADGTYAIGPVPVGHVPQAHGPAPATTRPAARSRSASAGATKNFSVRRTGRPRAAARHRGLRRPRLLRLGCGPPQAIDTQPGHRLGQHHGQRRRGPDRTCSSRSSSRSTLPAAVNVTDFAVDPTAACGDGGSASTGDFRIETSPNGTTWTQAASGTFTLDDRGRLNTVTPTAGTLGVQVRPVHDPGQPDPGLRHELSGGAFSGCSFTDLTEIEVHGAGS